MEKDRTSAPRKAEQHSESRRRAIAVSALKQARDIGVVQPGDDRRDGDPYGDPGVSQHTHRLESLLHRRRPRLHLSGHILAKKRDADGDVDVGEIRETLQPVGVPADEVFVAGPT